MCLMDRIREGVRALRDLFAGPAPEASAEVRDHCEPFSVSDQQLAAIMDDIDRAIRDGLARDTHDKAVVKCYPTYVQHLPDGTERGTFLALDLGGTNFRVLLIDLGVGIVSDTYKVPAEIRMGKGVQLFDHIAACLAQFVKKHYSGVRMRPLPLGFTFSFPLRQVGLDRGHLVNWTKGFSCEDVVGQDVVKLLQDAIGRRDDVSIKVCGILNDTTGTIMSCAWSNPNTRIGLIVGTGCNACYMERVECVELMDGGASGSHVVVNTEWGAFGDGGELEAVRTAYDRALDEASINAGRQRFEKMISGMYMGELVRRILVDLADRQLLFGGTPSAAIMTAGALDTSLVSRIEADDGRTGYPDTRRLLAEMGVNNASPADCANVRYVCEAVSTRSAHLVGAALAVLLNKIGEKSVTIGVDGTVFRCHPHFSRLLAAKTKQLTKDDIKFDLMLSEDGSGRGAALVAAMATRAKRAAVLAAAGFTVDQ